MEEDYEPEQRAGELNVGNVGPWQAYDLEDCRAPKKEKNKIKFGFHPPKKKKSKHRKR